MHGYWALALIAVTSYTKNETYQASIAMRQLEECGVPCDCHSCVSAYHRLESIQLEKERRELRQPVRDYFPFY